MYNTSSCHLLSKKVMDPTSTKCSGIVGKVKSLKEKRSRALFEILGKSDKGGLSGKTGKQFNFLYLRH